MAPSSIIEAARTEIVDTLNDLIDRYDYEIVRDALWSLKPDVTGQFWCGDCRRYVDEIVHECRQHQALVTGDKDK